MSKKNYKKIINIQKWVTGARFAKGIEVQDDNYNYYVVLNTYTSSSDPSTDVANGNLKLITDSSPINSIDSTSPIEIDWSDPQEPNIYALVNQPNGLVQLNGTGLIDASMLPSYVDDVLEFPTFGDFPTTGESGKIYVDASTSKIYRWSGTQYIEIVGGKGSEVSEILLLNTNDAVRGQEQEGVVDPLEQIEGWYFKGNSLTNKINWYIPSSAESGLKLSELSTVYALVNLRTLGASASIFFNVYTKRQNDGQDAGTWYRSRVTYADASLFVGQSDTVKLLHINDNPSDIYVGVDRIQLPIEVPSSVGIQDPSEDILAISISTSTAQQSQYIGDTEFVMSNFGMYNGDSRTDYILKAEDARQKLLTNEEVIYPKNSYTAGSEGDVYYIDKSSIRNNYVVITPSEDISSNGITIEGLNGALIDGSSTFLWNSNSTIVLKRTSVGGNWNSFEVKDLDYSFQQGITEENKVVSLGELFTGSLNGATINTPRIVELDDNGGLNIVSPTTGEDTNYKIFQFNGDNIGGLGGYFGFASVDTFPVPTQHMVFMGITPGSNSGGMAYQNGDVRYGFSINDGDMSMGVSTQSESVRGMARGISFPSDPNFGAIKIVNNNGTGGDPFEDNNGATRRVTYEVDNASILLNIRDVNNGTTLAEIEFEEDNFTVHGDSSFRGLDYSIALKTTMKSLLDFSSTSNDDAILTLQQLRDASIMKSGTSAQRPSNPVKGQLFFDDDLTYPIVYNGTDWVNFTGAIV